MFAAKSETMILIVAAAVEYLVLMRFIHRAVFEYCRSLQL